MTTIRKYLDVVNVEMDKSLLEAAEAEVDAVDLLGIEDAATNLKELAKRLK